MPDYKISSVRDLAQEIQVNPITMVKAYDVLSEAEIFINSRAVGFFVAEDALAKCKSLLANHFYTDQLPKVIETMLLLDINIEKVVYLYNQPKK